MSQTFETQIGGRTLTIETGKLATLAGGSVTVRYGDTMVLGTANRSEPRPGLDFFPLTVDFEERMYAAGKIPGGFIKREARPSENAILAARQTDRPIRPLFPKGYKDDVQLVITVLSTDQENLPGRRRHDRRIRGAHDQRDPVQRPDRFRACRPDRRRVRRQPDLQPDEGLRARPDRRRHPRRDHDGRGRREPAARGRHGRGDPVRPPGAPAHRRPAGELQKAVGKAKRIPYIEPPTDSVLDFASATDAKRELVVIDVETTGTDPKMSDLVEVAAVKIKGTKIVDRWSTFVNPGRSIVGNQMHGITDKDVQGAPSPKEAADKLLAFVGDALIVGHNVGFDLGFIEEARGEGFRFQTGQLPRHAGHRPRGLSRRRVVQAR